MTTLLHVLPAWRAAIDPAARAGGVFVPVNPLLKPPQVEHILNDCTVRVLVTSAERLAGLQAILPNCPALRLIVLVEEHPAPELPAGLRGKSWAEFMAPRATPSRTV